MSPESEAAIDEEKSCQAYNTGQEHQMAGANKKLSGLMQYLPYIALALVAIIGIYVYTQNQKISSDMNVMKLAIQNLVNSVPKK